MTDKVRPRMKLLAILAGLMAVSLAAQDYHLSPEGDDAADGSAGHPWKTIGKANRTLRAGDRAIFAAGTYPGTIAPYHSGLPGKPIVYTAQTPGTAVIAGSKVRYSGKPRPAAVWLAGRAFIKISGLVFRSTNAPLVLSGVRDSEFRDLEVHTQRPAIRANTLTRCTFRKISVASDETGKHVSADPLWRNLRAERCRFEALRLNGGGTLFLLAEESSGCIIRTVDLAAENGQGFVIGGTGHLMEKCRVRNAARPSEWQTADGLFRGNFFLGGQVRPLTVSGENNAVYGNAFLQKNDFGVDAGAVPARLTADTAGREMEVDRPEIFFDGGGIPGERGDTVEIGPEKISAVIVEIDRGRKLLHLDRTVRAEAGSEVRPTFGR